MTRRRTILGASGGNVRVAAAAGLTLFGLLAGHTILEVARDSLFLATLSARELPFTYLAIALVAWGAVAVDRRLAARIEQRRLAMLTLLFAAAGTVGFYFAFGSREWWIWWVPHLFYIWTGLVATFAVTQFWRLLADLFAIDEAKRLYSRIAAGGSLGAVTGAAVADLAQRWLEPRELLLFGAAFLVTTAFIPVMLLPKVEPIETPVGRRAGAEGSAQVTGYVRRLLLLVLLTAITATLVDYVFKATVDTELAHDQLGPFFSRFYVILTLVSLAVQILLAPRLLSWLGATRTLAVLPLLLAVAAIGHAASGAFVLAIVLRGSDGALRHSLHRSAFELLYLPLRKAVRDRNKTLIDALGQRGGQALASLGILLVTFLGVGTQQLAFVVAVLAAAWVALALILRGRYLDLFRANLRAGTIETRVEVPALDLMSLESLMASLNSQRDEEVLATLDVLDDYGRQKLVPALLLYHPSRAVVLRTLDIFADSARDDFVPVARRLLESDDDDVQAAAMHAITRLLTMEELRAELDQDHDRPVRATVLVGLATRGLEEANDELTLCAASDDLLVKMAVTRAIRLSANPELFAYLLTMSDGAPPKLRREIAQAFGALADVRAIPTLIAWVGARGARGDSRDSLAAIGEPARDALMRALSDPSLPRAVRGHVPRTLCRFLDETSAHALFEHLPREPDGWIRYKVLRALRPMREAMPQLRFDERALTEGVRKNVVRAAQVLGWRIALAEAHESDPSRRTRGGELLVPVLDEKEAQALDRAVRLIALSSPEEDFRRITHALRHADRRRRAESRELLSAIAPSSMAPAIEILLGDAKNETRLAQVRATIDVPVPPAGGYEGLLRELIVDESEAVRAVAAYHAGELALTALRDALVAARDLAAGISLDVVTRAIDEVDAARKAG